MARPLWFVKLLKKLFPNVKFIAKLTNIPLLGNVFDFLLFRGDDIIYLPQDTVIEVNKPLGEYNEYVLPSQVLEYFINKAKNHWIMNFCICRSSMDCQDYPVDLGCLFLGDAVLDINPQLGKLVTKKQALDHLRKCRDAGLVQMIGRNRLDAQWLGVSPGEKLLSICNCDPCCCLWRVSSILAPKIGSKIKKMPGVVIRVTDKCIGCGTCVGVCPQNAIEIVIDDEKYIKKSIQEIDNIIELA
jgi:Fe-S-cluster-containing hydrogenase component 2